MNTETVIEVLNALASNNSGIILARHATAKGVSRMMLTNLVRFGVLSRIATGQYVFAHESGDELYSLSCRSELFVFSHETALFLHRISERTPFVHTVTIPTNKKLAPSITANCKVYYVKSDLMNLGKILLATPQKSMVPCYDLERTICDIVRSRSRMSEETVLTSLKLYAARADKNLIKLSEYASAFNIEKKMKTSLEVLL